MKKLKPEFTIFPVEDLIQLSPNRVIKCKFIRNIFDNTLYWIADIRVHTLKMGVRYDQVEEKLKQSNTKKVDDKIKVDGGRKAKFSLPIVRKNTRFNSELKFFEVATNKGLWIENNSEALLQLIRLLCKLYMLSKEVRDKYEKETPETNQG